MERNDSRPTAEKETCITTLGLHAKRQCTRIVKYSFIEIFYSILWHTMTSNRLPDSEHDNPSYGLKFLFPC